MKLSWLAITLAGWSIVVSAAGPAPEDAAVDRILSRHIAAAGGRERLAAIQSETLTFQMEQAGEVFELRVSFESGEKTLLEATSAHGWKVKQGQAAPGGRWRKSPDELTDRPKPEDLLEFRELALCLSATAVLELRQHFPVLRLLGTERTGSKDCQVVEASMGKDLGLKMWFGQKSGLLEKAGIATLEDYKLEQGVMVPHTVTRPDNTVLKLKSVVFNEAIPDEVFEKPKETVPTRASRQTAQAPDPVPTEVPTQPNTAQTPPLPRISCDPRIELVSLVFRLAGNPEYNHARVATYATEVEKQFRPFQKHPCIALARQLHTTQGISYDACMSLAVLLTGAEDPRLRVALDPWPEFLDRRWTAESATNFVALLGRFARDSRFEQFVQAHAAAFEVTQSRLKSMVEADAHLEWFERFFGARPPVNFTIIPALLNGGACYGPHSRDSAGCEELFCILGVWETDSQGLPVFRTGMLGTVVHEFCHSYANPIIDRHIRQLEPAGQKLFARVARQMEAQAYGSPETLLRESLVRACVVRYVRQYEGRLAADLAVAQQIARSFSWMGELSDLLGDYEQHRERYPDLEAFSARLIQFFNDYAEKSEREANAHPPAATNEIACATSS